jgi:hypothetical protein
MNFFTANQITNTVFIKKGISLQIRMIRGDEWIAFPVDYRRSTTFHRLFNKPNMDILGLRFWCLMPPSTIFQLYHGCQFCYKSKCFIMTQEWLMTKRIPLSVDPWVETKNDWWLRGFLCQLTHVWRVIREISCGLPMMIDSSVWVLYTFMSQRCVFFDKFSYYCILLKYRLS